MAKGRDEHQARQSELDSFGKDLAKRSKSKCELCGESTSLMIYEVPPVVDPEFEKCIMICEPCQEQVEDPKKLNVNHWHCLNETAWSEVPAVQVVVWRLLQQLSSESWAEDLKDQLYLDEEIVEWAENDGSGSKSTTLDCNGVPLNSGDSVTVIKDLDVKGAGFTAKRGTVVKNIHLTSNPEHIEGRVNKTKIVLKTCFLKKVN
ncbi:MAG: PhnA domain-containing protein [Lentisphaeraceae bacterium]|nr:PhnA domain-containing protein [Lentisphaeraceae bacterium]